MPTAEQRRRILELLTSLAPHHTKECTRNAQPLYVQQALHRYSPLVGHQVPHRSSFSDWNPFLEPEDDFVQVIRREIANIPTGTREHKVFFALNLYKLRRVLYYCLFITDLTSAVLSM